MSKMEHPINHAQLQREFVRCMKAGLVPYVRSSPGVGKSDAAHQFADKYKLQVIDLRLSQCTPEDLQGFPMRTGNKATFTPFDLFPLEGEDKPKGKQGWLLLLDELSSANKGVQAAAYKLILDRQVGSFNLHEDCYIIACGNNITDKAVVHKMSTALQSRLVHFDLKVTVKDWVKWAMGAGIDYRITAYVQWQPAMLMNFSADHVDNTYACPRTWEFLSRLIAEDEVLTREEHQACVCGTIGSGAGIQFMSFCEVQKDLPRWEDIINPKVNDKLPVPAETSARYAVTTWIAAKASKEEIMNCIPYMERFNADLQVIWCRGIIARFPNLDSTHPKFIEYAMSMMMDIND